MNQSSRLFGLTAGSRGTDKISPMLGSKAPALRKEKIQDFGFATDSMQNFFLSLKHPPKFLRRKKTPILHSQQQQPSERAVLKSSQAFSSDTEVSPWHTPMKVHHENHSPTLKASRLPSQVIDETKSEDSGSPDIKH